MKKIISICLALLTLFSILTLGACDKKEPEAELTEAQKFAAKIDVKIDKKIPFEDGKITFTVTNNADRDCHILGPLGRDRLQFRFSTNPPIYTYMANTNEYYEDDYLAGCQVYNEREYLTVAAGTSVEYTLKGEWFVSYSPNMYKLMLLITDDVTDGVFETMIEKEFEVR